MVGVGAVGESALVVAVPSPPPPLPPPSLVPLSPIPAQAQPELTAPSPRPESPAKTAQFRASLELLPNELIQDIVAALVPIPPSTTRFALRPTGTWELHDTRHQWTDWLISHNNLLFFAQTSQRMAAIAKPSLYYNVMIHSGADLVRLAIRLTHRPEIRPWIREIAVLVNLAGVLTIADVHRAWEKQTGGESSSQSLGVSGSC